MNRKLLAVAVAGAVAPMTAQALDVSVSGQVNRAIRFADDGANSDVQHIDGSASGSRFWLKAEGEVMPGIMAGAVMEQEFAVNRGWEADIDAADKGLASGLRHSWLYFSGSFGKVGLGHTAPVGGVMGTAFNDAAFGTEYSADTNSGISVMTSDDMKAVCGMAATPTIAPAHGDDGEHMSTMDPVYCIVASFLPTIGVGRHSVLRYDTPSIGPATVGVSVQKDGADDHLWNFAGSVNQDFGAGTFKGELHLAEDVLAIAGGIQFANGTAVNAAWGNDDRKGQDYDDLYTSIAHSWGNTTVALGYRTTDNNKNMEGRAIGLGVNQSLGSGVDVYAGFNNYSFDMPDADLEDVTAFHIGSRVSFN